MLASLLDAFSFHLFGPPTFTQKDLDALIEEVAALDRSDPLMLEEGSTRVNTDLAVLNGVAQTATDERLRELGETARSEHALMVGAVNDAVVHAVALGEALIEAKALVPAGGFTAWLAQNLPDGRGQPSCVVYMRLAAHKEHIDPTLSINANRDLVRGLARRSTSAPRIAEKTKAEALRLYATGKFSPAEIGRIVGTTRDTVRYWAEPGFAEQKLRQNAEHRRVQRAERRRQREQQPPPDRPFRYGEPGRAAIGRAVRVLARTSGKDATCEALYVLAAICQAWAERLGGADDESMQEAA